MGTYILMTKLAPEVTSDIKHREKIGRNWMKKVSAVCPEVKWVNHYALLGPYDFMCIYEAPDVDTAAKVAVISMSLGAQKAESWPAIPYADFIRMLDSIS